MNFTPNMTSIIAENKKRAGLLISSSDSMPSKNNWQSPSQETLAYTLNDDDLAPPPYKEARRQGLRATRSVAHLPSQPACPAYMEVVDGVPASKTPFMLDLMVGHSLAAKLIHKRDVRRQQRLDKVHDAWHKLGLDTRKIVAEGHMNLLPPHFWTPPRYDAAEMNRRLRELAL